MKELVNGIVLYGLNDLILKEAFEFAEYFFKKINITPNLTSYFYNHAPDKNGETLSINDISPLEMKEKLNDREVKDFRLSYFVNDLHWDVSFSFSSKETIWKMNYIDIQFLNSIAEIKQDNILKIISCILKDRFVDYGIGYQLTGDTSSAFDYVFSLDGSDLYEYENSSEWLYQLPFRTHNLPQYLEKLRMVYLLNILNEKHLQQNILGMDLESWILSNKKNGNLISLNSYNKLWLVDVTELERVNTCLGKEGLLISWEEPKIKSFRKLP